MERLLEEEGRWGRQGGEEVASTAKLDRDEAEAEERRAATRCASVQASAAEADRHLADDRTGKKVVLSEIRPMRPPRCVRPRRSSALLASAELGRDLHRGGLARGRLSTASRAAPLLHAGPCSRSTPGRKPAGSTLGRKSRQRVSEPRSRGGKRNNSKEGGRRRAAVAILG
jgi:hypothetical protein